MDTSFQKLQIQDEKFQEYLSRGTEFLKNLKSLLD